MKPEHTGAPSGHAFNSVKDIEAGLRGRMDKAVTDLQHNMAAIRTGRASVNLLDHVRVSGVHVIGWRQLQELFSKRRVSS